MMYPHIPIYCLVVGGLSSLVALAGIPGVESLPMWMLSVLAVGLAGVFYVLNRRRPSLTSTDDRDGLAHGDETSQTEPETRKAA